MVLSRVLGIAIIVVVIIIIVVVFIYCIFIVITLDIKLSLSFIVLTCLVSAAAFQTGNRFFTYGRSLNMALSQDELKKMVGYKVCKITSLPLLS